MQAMQMGDPHGTIRKHLMAHQAQMMGKAMAAQQKMQGGPPQGGGGGEGSSGGQPPAGGAQPGTPSNIRQPPGAIAPDQMAKMGGIQAPRK